MGMASFKFSRLLTSENTDEREPTSGARNREQSGLNIRTESDLAMGNEEEKQKRPQELDTLRPAAPDADAYNDATVIREADPALLAAARAAIVARGGKVQLPSPPTPPKSPGALAPPPAPGADGIPSVAWENEESDDALGSDAVLHEISTEQQPAGPQPPVDLANLALPKPAPTGFVVPPSETAAPSSAAPLSGALATGAPKRRWGLAVALLLVVGAAIAVFFLRGQL
jgi:hypothetical protein